MPSRIEVGFKPSVLDAQGLAISKKISSDLGISVSKARVIDTYTIEAQLPVSEIEFLGKEVFVDPIVQVFSSFLAQHPAPLAKNAAWGSSDFAFAIEAGFLPGVTDNIGKTAKEAIEDALKRKIEGGVYFSRQYYFWGNISGQQANGIAQKLLTNGLIERYTILDKEEFAAQNGFPIAIPKVMLAHQPQVKEINVVQPLEKLEKMSDEMCLALSKEELVAIKKHFSSAEVAKVRAEAGLPASPTDVELEMLAQTWSEHCKHKIFNAKIRYERADGKTKAINSLFKTYIKKATDKVAKKSGLLVSVFSDNAGIIKFTSDYNLVMKVETHNSPSALDPYGGALTGIVGVNRDVLGAGLGASFSFNTDVFCFASPFYTGTIPPKLMHPKRIFQGVRKGVEQGGNTTGVPTVNGSIVFDDRFLGKPLVYCGTGGIIPVAINGKPSEQKVVHVGDNAIMVGGRVGKDGIHGATFSSQELNETSPATAVQIGDPITQRKMYDMLLVARDRGLYSAITDNGAGGLSSSIGEMCRETGGAELCLDKVPLKYHGLDPWEILVSESQERMTVCVAPEKLNEFMQLAAHMQVEATPVGKFTDTGKFIAKFNEKTVCSLDMGFLHEGAPQMKLRAKLNEPEKTGAAANFAQPSDLNETLKSILGRLNICSKEYVVRQYDHEVQGTSVVKPLEGAQNDGPSDAGVLMPVIGNKRAVVVSNGICPKYSDFDSYSMSACAFDEAVRNAVATGADPKTICALDNFCWPDPVESSKTPDGAHKLGQLVEACSALYDCALAYKAPLISGKDSMKNDYKIGDVKISVPPTVLYTCLGQLAEASKAVTIDAKGVGDFIYVVGMTKEEMGASEYFLQIGQSGGRAPRPDLKTAPLIYKKLHAAMNSRLVASCHDCSDGGIAVALSETLFSGGFGGTLDLRLVPQEGISRDDMLLFSESASRFIVTVKQKHAARFEKKMAGLPFAKAGIVTSEPMLEMIGLQGEKAISSHIQDLKGAWKKTLDW